MPLKVIAQKRLKTVKIGDVKKQLKAGEQRRKGGNYIAIQRRGRN